MSSDTLSASEQAWLSQTLSLVSRRPKSALSRARNKLSRIPRTHTLFRAKTERLLGHALRATGDYLGAASAYGRSRKLFRRVGDPHDHAVSGLGLIDAYMYLGRHKDAIRVADESRRVFLTLGDSVRLGRLDTNVGNLFHRLDALEEALQHYEMAARHLRTSGSKADLGRVNYNRANVLASLGRIEEARALFSSARAAFEESGDSVLAAQVSYGDACLDLLGGEYASAMAKLEDVRPRLKELGAKPLLALADLDLAEVLLALRLYPEALAVGNNAARWFRRHNVPLQLAASEYVVGACLVHVGDIKQGAKILAQADKRFRHQRHEPGRASVAMARALIERSIGHPLRAARHAKRAEDVFLRKKLRSRALIASVLNVDLLLEGGRTVEGEARGRELLRKYRSGHDAGGRARIRRLLGRTAYQFGRVSTALKHYEIAIKEWNKVRAGFFVDEWRLQYEHGQPILLDEFLQALLARRPSPTAREIWDWIARIQYDGWQDSARRAPPPSPQAKEEITRLRRELDYSYARLLATAGPGRGHQSDADGVQLQTRILGIERRLQRLAAVRTSSMLRDRPPSSRAEPHPEAVPLLAYFAVGDMLGGLLLSRRDAVIPNLISLSELDLRIKFLRHRVERIYQPGTKPRMRNDINKRIQEDLRFLGQRLLDPLLDAQDQSDVLYVVPYDGVNQLPFHALPWRGTPLMNQCEVRLEPFQTRRMRQPHHDHPPSALVMGFDSAGSGLVEREARSISSRLLESGVKVDQFIGQDATRQQLFQSAGEVDLIHLAAHGLYRAEHPEFSAIRLADRWVNASDFDTMNLSGATVVLSACETGSGATVAGHEILGLVRGILRAGALAVLASLWRVDDAATYDFMRSLYENWERHGSLGPALRATRNDYDTQGVDHCELTRLALTLYGSGEVAWPGLRSNG